jgi:hypothetical protein
MFCSVFDMETGLSNLFRSLDQLICHKKAMVDNGITQRLRKKKCVKRSRAGCDDDVTSNK